MEEQRGSATRPWRRPAPSGSRRLCVGYHLCGRLRACLQHARGGCSCMPAEQCTTSPCKTQPGQPLICALPGLCMKSWGSGCVLGASLLCVQEGTTRSHHILTQWVALPMHCGTVAVLRRAAPWAGHPEPSCDLHGRVGQRHPQPNAG